MPPINESSNVMVCERPCKTEPLLPSNTIEPDSAPGCWAGDMAEGGAATFAPPVVSWIETDSPVPVFVSLYHPNQRQNPEEGDQRPFMMEDSFPFIVLECFPGIVGNIIIHLYNRNSADQQQCQKQDVKV